MSFKIICPYYPDWSEKVRISLCSKNSTAFNILKLEIFLQKLNNKSTYQNTGFEIDTPKALKKLYKILYKNRKRPGYIKI